MKSLEKNMFWLCEWIQYEQNPEAPKSLNNGS